MALLARAKAILEKAPLIDTHNDLPSMLLNGTAVTSRGSTSGSPTPSCARTSLGCAGAAWVRRTGPCGRTPRT